MKSLKWSTRRSGGLAFASAVSMVKCKASSTGDGGAKGGRVSPCLCGAIACGVTKGILACFPFAGHFLKGRVCWPAGSVGSGQGFSQEENDEVS